VEVRRARSLRQAQLLDGRRQRPEQHEALGGGLVRQRRTIERLLRFRQLLPQMRIVAVHRERLLEERHRVGVALLGEQRARAQPQQRTRRGVTRERRVEQRERRARLACIEFHLRGEALDEAVRLGQSLPHFRDRRARLRGVALRGGDRRQPEPARGLVDRAVAQLPLEIHARRLQSVDGAVGQRAKLRARQPELGAVGTLAVAAFADPRLDIGDPRRGDRVRAQVLGGAAVVEPAGALQAVQERDHRVRVEIALAQHLEADSIGLALGVAREAEHLLLRDRASERRETAGRLRIRAGGERGEHHRREHDDRPLPLARKHARDVPLRHVSDLVREHGSELGFRLRADDQPRVHADEAAGQRERVQRRIADEEEAEVVSGGRRSAREREREAVEPVGELGIVVDHAAALHLADDRFADASLHRRRQLVGARVAQARQVVDLRVGERRGEREHGGQQARHATGRQTSARQLRHLRKRRCYDRREPPCTMKSQA